MQFQVDLNESPRMADLDFADGNKFGFLEQWRRELNNEPYPHPWRSDTVEFADLARHKFAAHSTIQPYAKEVADFKTYIDDDPHCEVACLALLRCDWFPPCDVIGLVHFRRTWCNRIVLDYLCAHPEITKPSTGCRHVVSGVGSGLLSFVANVAMECGCDAIWGEATQNSWKYYKKVFRLEEVQDLIYAPKDNFVGFLNRLSAELGAKRERKPSPQLDEVYKIEAENPPFVGNKAAVFTLPRKLVQHFLDLPFNQKLEVAAALSVAGNSASRCEDVEMFRLIFKHATEVGKLHELWKEVEKRHEHGDPSNNPFPEP